MRAFQIANGVGSGNIGDELMARAFWDQLGDQVRLDVAVLPEYRRQREPYPSIHQLVPVDWNGIENRETRCPGLLVGDTPVAEAEGLQWPLQFLAPRLEHFHRHQLPVDALGVGVERLASDAARDLFRRAFLPIRSWTVRSPACREALLALGVGEEQVVVGADWAWLYRPRRDLRDWAAAAWQALGVDPSRPLVAVNVVNMIWKDCDRSRQALAEALDTLAARDGFQIAFFSNECRDGDYYDHAAALEIRGRMREPAVVAPNHYYAPEEALALLAYAAVAVSERYHFSVQAVLAGTIPVDIVRGQKMRGLVEELGLESAGAVEQVSSEAVVASVRTACADRAALRARLGARAELLRGRARENLAFFRRYYPCHTQETR